MSNSISDPFMEAEAGDEETSKSAVYAALSNERRSHALSVLASETPMDVRALAEAVAAREADREMVSDEYVKRIHISLYHVHLPKLADLGVIEYDTGGPVEAVADEIEPFVP